MEITLFGIIWFLIIFILLFLPIKYTVGALMISTIFQAASVINLTDKGIYATILLEFFLIIKFLLLRKDTVTSNIKRDNEDELNKGLIIFLIFSTIISIISPIFFKSIYINNKYSLRNPFLIVINSKLILRIVIIFINILTLIIFHRIREKIDEVFFFKIIKITIILALFFGFWEFIWKATGKIIFFPEKLLYGNIGYTQGYNQGYISGALNFFNVRMNSTYLEPSYFGAFLTASIISIFSMKNVIKNKKILIFFLMVALGLNMSATGIISFVIMSLFYFILYKKTKMSKKGFISIFMLIVITMFMLIKTRYLYRIISMLTNKLSNISGIQRTYYDKLAIIIFFKSCFLGTGLTSYRASSFITTMLATVGFLGSLIFFNSTIKYLKKAKAEIENYDCLKFGYFFTISSLISMCISIPDITFLPMWFGFMCLMLNNRKDLRI